MSQISQEQIRLIKGIGRILQKQSNTLDEIHKMLKYYLKEQKILLEKISRK